MEYKPDKNQPQNINCEEYKLPPEPRYKYQNDKKIDDELNCQYICYEPLLEPMVHIKCQNTFCKECISKIKYECPVCRKGNFDEYEMVTLKSFLNLLDKLKIVCSNCNKIFRRCEFKEHINNCLFSCPRNCGEKLNRKIFNEHDLKCINKTIICPIGCQYKIKLCFLKEHENLCPKKIINCTANDIGCKEMIYRSEVQLHSKSCHYVQLRPVIDDLINQNKHLQKEIQDLLELNDNLKNKISNLEYENKNYRLLKTIDEYNKKIKSASINKNTNEMLYIFDEMKKNNILLNIKTYTIIIEGFCRSNMIENADKYYQELINKGLKPDVYIYTVLIRGCFGDKNLIKKYYKEMMKFNVEPDNYILNILEKNNIYITNK